MNTCECADPGCPVHKGKSACDRTSKETLYRIDMTDETGTLMCFKCAGDAMDSGVFTTDAPENDEGEPDEDGGDILSSDDNRWFQYGKLYHTGDRDSLLRKMEQDQFYPNVWIISDHGNSCLIEV